MPRASRIGGKLSLERKLPLLLTGVFAAALVALLGATYAILSSRAESIVRDRLVHAARQVARTARPSPARDSALRAAAEDPALRRLLDSQGRGGDVAAARAAMARAHLQRDTTLPVVLWDARRQIVAAAGNSAAATPPRGSSTASQLEYSPFQPAGDRIRFWTFAPIPASGTPAGWLAESRYLTGPADAAQSLRELMREEVSAYMRNADGSVWAAFPGTPAVAPTRRDSTSAGVSYERPGVGRLLAEEVPVAGGPWVVVLESPASWVYARPWSTVRSLALVSLALAILGALLSWALSRQITKPIVALMSTVELVAPGTSEHPAVGRGGDEIGRLARSFDKMAREVTATQQELERRVAEAEEANRAKSDFLAMMSHELRTPLNAIGGYAELIEMGIHGPVTDAQRDALTRITRSQAHLLTLINELLSFAQIDAGQMSYAVSDVSLRDALEGLDELVAPQVRARRLTLTVHPCDSAIVVRADADKLRQIVLNLLSNAVKYTGDGGRVSVACDADDEHVRIHVRDTGSGIPANRLEVIFEPFVQGERALNKPSEGVGLGLSISRELAQGMGGSVTVNSGVGRGSTFTVTLPRGREPSDESGRRIKAVRAVG